MRDKMINESLFSSNKDDWETPQELFKKLHKEFNFSIDLCASSQNAKLPRYYSEKDSALKTVTCMRNNASADLLAQALHIDKSKVRKAIEHLLDREIIGLVILPNNKFAYHFVL